MIRPEDEVVIAGDVHGDARRLERLLHEFARFPGRIVLVGDYVNRGPASREVLQMLCDAQSARALRLVLLRGNHDESLLVFLAKGVVEDFAMHGGLATIYSYIGSGLKDPVSEFRSSFPDHHRRLLNSLNRSFATPDLFVSHGGFSTERPMDFDDPAVVHGDPRIFRHRGTWPRSLTIVGHYLQNSMQPFISDRLIALDTGCGTLPEGPLTAVRMPGGALYQF